MLIYILSTYVTHNGQESVMIIVTKNIEGVIMKPKKLSEEEKKRVEKALSEDEKGLLSRLSPFQRMKFSKDMSTLVLKKFCKECRKKAFENSRRPIKDYCPQCKEEIMNVVGKYWDKIKWE